MIVADIYEDAKKILGICDQARIMDILTDAVKILSSHGDFDPQLATVDVCVSGQYVTLPRDVQTVLALKIGGRPAIARDQLFSFHINGAGDCGWKSCSNLSWTDLGKFPTFRDIACPSKIVAFVENADDEGAEVWVYGVDQQGREIRTEVGGVMKRGYLVPTIFGYALPTTDAPSFSRVTGIRKGDTKGTIRISSFDNSTSTGTLLAILAWDDNESLYRRIELSRNCGDYIQIHYRRTVFKLRALEDFIPVNSGPALKMMLRALKFYDESDFGNAESAEATALRWMSQEQQSSNPPTQTPIQVDDSTPLQDKQDDVD